MSKKWILCVNFYYIYIPYAWLFEDHPIYRVLLKGVIVELSIVTEKRERKTFFCALIKKFSPLLLYSYSILGVRTRVFLRYKRF
jgi:hypothetical protein